MEALSCEQLLLQARQRIARNGYESMRPRCGNHPVTGFDKKFVVNRLAQLPEDLTKRRLAHAQFPCRERYASLFIQRHGDGQKIEVEILLQGVISKTV